MPPCCDVYRTIISLEGSTSFGDSPEIDVSVEGAAEAQR